MNSALRSPLLRVSAVLLALLCLTAVFADLLASEAPLVASVRGDLVVLPAVIDGDGWDAASAPADWAIWAPVRSDRAQFVHGARSLVVVTGAVLVIALVIGVGLGLLAGAGPRAADFLLTRCVELTGVLPALVLVALVRAGERWPATLSFVVVVGALHALRIARLVRGEVLGLAGQPFVVAATALGASPARVLLRHILPQTAGPVLITAAFTAASVVALEAALSFVGLGLGPEHPSWGALLGAVASGEPGHGWLLPAAGVALTTGALYVVARKLDDALNPRRVRALEAISSPPPWQKPTE